MAPTCTTASQAMTIDRFAATAVDAVVADRLLALTLPEGEMAKVFRACANPARHDWTGQVLTATVDAELVGWALRWKVSDRSRWNLHLFVAEHARRRKVASTLVAAARYRLRGTTTLRGFVWDDQSAKFWAATASGPVIAPDYR